MIWESAIASVFAWRTQRQLSFVKELRVRHNQILRYPSKIFFTEQFVACQLNQASIAIMQYAYLVPSQSINVRLLKFCETQYFASVQIINQQP